MQRTGYRFVSRLLGCSPQLPTKRVWIRQDIMGDPRSFHVLVAEPRFLLVKRHTAAGVIQFCVYHGPDSTRDQAEIQAWWRRSAALIRSVCLVSSPLVVLCDANARVGSVASLAAGDQAAGWEDTTGAEFHAVLRERILCLPATLPAPHNDPAKPSGTWCSRTRWHRIDFVAVARWGETGRGRDGYGASKEQVF